MPVSKSSKISDYQLQGALYDSISFDQMKTADVLVFENPMMKASFAVKYSASVVEARITISSGNPVQGVLQFDYNSLPHQISITILQDEATIYQNAVTVNKE